VNTCSVTAEADRQARAFIRRAHRQNPDARILVTGCYAQRAPGELANIAGVSAVVGNSHKALVPQIALNLMGGSPARELVQISTATPAAPQVLADDLFAHSFIEELQLTPGAQTRPNLKIQEGCGNRCTFCVIPTTRGPSKSLPGAAVMRQVEGFIASGGNELVLSGINLGRWGRDLHSDTHAASLAALVRHILERTRLPRLRLSSIEPMDWDSGLIALMHEFAGPHSSPGRLARHAHLPLQSGSDAVLRRMHRRYRPWHYVDKVHALLSAAGPGLTLGADVMVGFPGETDAEFEETVALIRSLPFGYLHLFPFSPRPGTRGGQLHADSPVPAAAVHERMSALRSLAAEKTHTHRAGFLNRELDAITLHTPAETAFRNRTSALTENFLPIEVDGSLPANQLLRVQVTGLDAHNELSGRKIA
jgi:threonylcarbamoyladenosine tRNA methylthiotransferase MtaB